MVLFVTSYICSRSHQGAPGHISGPRSGGNGLHLKSESVKPGRNVKENRKAPKIQFIQKYPKYPKTFKMLNLAATAAARPWSLAANGGARKKMSKFCIHFIVSVFYDLLA